MSEWVTVARAEEVVPGERRVTEVDDAQVVDQCDRFLRDQFLHDRDQGYATYRFLLLDALY